MSAHKSLSLHGAVKLQEKSCSFHKSDPLDHRRVQGTWGNASLPPITRTAQNMKAIETKGSTHPFHTQNQGEPEVAENFSSSVQLHQKLIP